MDPREVQCVVTVLSVRQHAAWPHLWHLLRNFPDPVVGQRVCAHECRCCRAHNAVNLEVTRCECAHYVSETQRNCNAVGPTTPRRGVSAPLHRLQPHALPFRAWPPLRVHLVLLVPQLLEHARAGPGVVACLGHQPQADGVCLMLCQPEQPSTFGTVLESHWITTNDMIWFIDCPIADTRLVQSDYLKGN